MEFIDFKKGRTKRYLGWFTVGIVYFLMVWGNIVSSTGSGLACPDWPLCHGTLTPPAKPDIILEWGHRVLAFLGSIFILLTGIQVFASREPFIQNLKKVLFVFLLSQVLLGGVTVLLELSPLASTIHLLIACLIFGSLIFAACLTSGTPISFPNTSPKIRRLSLAALGAMLFQFALGGLLRHNHLGLACPGFPNCTDQFLPIPWTFGTFLAFFHRWWGISLLGVFFHLARVAKKTASPLKRASQLTFILSVGQVLLGVLTVTSGLHTHTRATHAALGYALWGLLVYIAIRSGGLFSKKENRLPLDEPYPSSPLNPIPLHDPQPSLSSNSSNSQTFSRTL